MPRWTVRSVPTADPPRASALRPDDGHGPLEPMNAEPIPLRRSPLQVVLLEDQPEHRQLVELQLLAFSPPATLLGSSETLAGLLELLAQHGEAVDAVIADLHVHDAAGVEIVHAIRSHAPTLPVVVLTSSTDQADEPLRAGAQDYLQKGQVSSEDLEISLRHAVRRQVVVNQLASANRDIEQLVYSFTHDLRGPLSVAGGFLSLLEETDLDERQTGMVEPLGRALARMDGLTGDLIDYARSAHGELEREPTDLATVASESALDLQALDRVEVGALPVVDVDPRLIRHLFDNLIGNSLKYADEARPVRVAITAVPHRAGWQVNVDDNGRGLPADQRERVFDMFVRAAEDSEVAGTGLGLAICQRVIDRHGGRIWVTDNPAGPGTRVAFLLPVEETSDERVAS